MVTSRAAPLLNPGNEVRPDAGQRGAVIFEVAIVMPFLLMLGISLYEVYGMIAAHHALRGSAREGVRIAGSTAYLEPGRYQFSFSGSKWQCQGPGTSKSAPGPVCTASRQRMVLEAVLSHIRTYAWHFNLDLDKTLIAVTYNAPADFTEVIVEATYRGFLPPFREAGLSAREIGPYL